MFFDTDGEDSTMVCPECDAEVPYLVAHLVVQHGYEPTDAATENEYQRATARELHPKMPWGGFGEP